MTVCSINCIQAETSPILYSRCQKHTRINGLTLKWSGEALETLKLLHKCYVSLHVLSHQESSIICVAHCCKAVTITDIDDWKLHKLGCYAEAVSCMQNTNC